MDFCCCCFFPPYFFLFKISSFFAAVFFLLLFWANEIPTLCMLFKKKPHHESERIPIDCAYLVCFLISFLSNNKNASTIRVNMNLFVLYFASPLAFDGPSIGDRNICLSCNIVFSVLLLHTRFTFVIICFRF